MGRIPFSEDELKIVGEIPGFFPNLPGTAIYNYPVTPKEACRALINKDPVWQVTPIDISMFNPRIIPDNIARALVIEANPLKREEFGGKDMFGIEWEYVEVANGSMVKPGSPLLSDANEWEDKVVFPDIDSWDWKGSAEANREFLKSGLFVQPFFMTGYFERLISFMDFDCAVMALIDEEQKDAVKALFEKLTDLYTAIVDRMIEYYNIDGITIHDDWGSQRAPFFSPATAREMVVPAMKRVTACIHDRELVADLHSCGHLEMQVPQIIEAGWDSWGPQTMNDSHMLYEKYGDKLVIGINPEPLPESATEDEQRAAAADFVEKYCHPDKPALLNFYAMAMQTPAFRKELYRLSRIKFGGQ
ncbi:uroporphyrinogen decarboxylase family protein [Thermodesulfobacteriota bacterium]